MEETEEPAEETEEPMEETEEPMEETEEPEAEPITIGVILAVTGPAAFPSTQDLQGIEMAIEEINADGGVLGRPLEINVQDEQCNATEGINAFNNLIQQDAELFLGASCSGTTLAIMPLMIDNEAVMINSMSTNPDITAGDNPWMFRVNPPDSAFAPAFGGMIVRELGDTKLAILSANNDFGRGAAEAFRGAVEAEGGEIVSEDFYSSDGPWDFSSVLTGIRDSEAEGIIWVGTSEPGFQFIRQYHEQGLTQTIYNRGISLTDTLFDELGDLSDGIYAIEPYFAEIDTDANLDFVERFRDVYGETPAYQAVTGYASTYVLAAAIEAAGTTDAAAVRDALADVNYDAVTGPIAFDENNQGHLPVFIASVACDDSGCSVEIIASTDW